MIDLPKVRTVFVKEWRESLRDRRTLFATFAVPIMLYPVIMLLMVEAAKVAKTRIEREEQIVAIDPPGELPLFEEMVWQVREAEAKARAEKTKQAEREEKSVQGTASGGKPPTKFRSVIFEDPKAALQAGDVQAVVRFPEHFRRDIHSERLAFAEIDQTPRVEILYDRAERRSREAVEWIRSVLNRYNGLLIKQRLEKHRLGSAFLTPFRVKKPQDVAPEVKVSGSQWGTVLPILFIMIIISGGIYPAIDMTAGEKERGTLETLIAAPVRPLDVICGKFLCIASLSLLSAFLNVASFALTFYAAGIDTLASLRLPWSALPATLLLLSPLTLFFAALLLAVTSFATSTREAQVYVLPVYLIPMLGLLVITIPGLELEGPLLVAPVINTALLIRELFLGHQHLLEPFAFVFVSTSLYAAAAVALAARIFAREEVLFSSQGALRIFLNRRFFKPQGAPRASDALLVAALVFPVWFYFSASLQRALLQAGQVPSPFSTAMLLLLPLALAILGGPLAASWYLKLDWKETFLYRVPSVRALGAALCLGGSSWILARQSFELIRWLWPVSMQGPEVLDEMIRQMPPAAALALLALAPALCEEHLFRGFLLSGLRQGHRKGPAIVLAAALFAAFHLPVFRQPITFGLGLALGYLAWESRSLWPGVLFHLLHNGLALFFADHLLAADADPLASPPLLVNPRLLAPALVFFGLGLWLAKGSGPRPKEDRAPKVSPGEDHRAAPEARARRAPSGGAP